MSLLAHLHFESVSSHITLAPFLFFFPRMFHLSTRFCFVFSLESSSSFHLVSKFPANPCPFSGCCEYHGYHVQSLVYTMKNNDVYSANLTLFFVDVSF